MTLLLLRGCRTNLTDVSGSDWRALFIYTLLSDPSPRLQWDGSGYARLRMIEHDVAILFGVRVY